MNVFAVIAPLLAAAVPDPGFARTCDVPVVDWQPREALRAMLEAAGWHVGAIVVRNGCYAAVLSDDRGYETDALFDPRTLSEVTDGH